MDDGGAWAWACREACAGEDAEAEFEFEVKVAVDEVRRGVREDRPEARPGAKAETEAKAGVRPLKGEATDIIDLILKLDTLIVPELELVELELPGRAGSADPRV